MELGPHQCHLFNYWTSSRISIFRQQLDQSMSQDITGEASSPPTPSGRDPITCHVLDLASGLPAANIPVTLTLLEDNDRGISCTASAMTNADGRVTQWEDVDGCAFSVVFRGISNLYNRTMTWTLEFDTLSHFGEGNTFFPEVKVRFFVDPKQNHYHVPLLLGPYSYTTYRGS